MDQAELLALLNDPTRSLDEIIRPALVANLRKALKSDRVAHPLDAARLMLEPEADGRHLLCGTMVAEGHHASCELAAVPMIVAALEATQMLVDAHVQAGGWRVVDDPKELGDRQHAALVALWELGIRPSIPKSENDGQ